MLRKILSKRYESNPLLMYSMKMSHLYKHLYEGWEPIYILPEIIYQTALTETASDTDNKYAEMSAGALKEKFLESNQELKYRDIVKFCIIRKIHADPELSQTLFTDAVRRDLDLVITCALLPDSLKTDVGVKLRKRGFSTAEQHELVNCLGTIEKAVDTAIPQDL